VHGIYKLNAACRPSKPALFCAAFDVQVNIHLPCVFPGVFLPIPVSVLPVSFYRYSTVPAVHKRGAATRMSHASRIASDFSTCGDGCR
jgi:hypothetical protein